MTTSTPSPSPEHLVVVCNDGNVRHADPFTNAREAGTWSYWGHACTAQHATEAYTSEDDARARIARGGRGTVSIPDAGLRARHAELRAMGLPGLVGRTEAHTLPDRCTRPGCLDSTCPPAAR